MDISNLYTQATHLFNKLSVNKNQKLEQIYKQITMNNSKFENKHIQSNDKLEIDEVETNIEKDSLVLKFEEFNNKKVEINSSLLRSIIQRLSIKSQNLSATEIVNLWESVQFEITIQRHNWKKNSLLNNLQTLLN